MTRNDYSFYARVLQYFVQTGLIDADADADGVSDPLLSYILSLLQKSDVQLPVLQNPICAQVFYDLMIQFVQQYLDKRRFYALKSSSERGRLQTAASWSHERCAEESSLIIDALERQYAVYGFDADFYRRDVCHADVAYARDVWQKMLVDWEVFMQIDIEARMQTYLSLNTADLERRLKHFMEIIPPYLADHEVLPDEFAQCWSLMNGLWNTVDFERYRKVVRIQRTYPCLLQIADLMGRTADDDGARQVQMANGTRSAMDHASHSDIEGITVGNDLNALLPSELAQCLDDDLDSMFLYKFLTQKLQTFRHRSTILKPARKLERQRARQKGPIIVCLDTSASMSGAPERIAFAQMMKLLEVADHQQRGCFLIAFSESAAPVDVHQQRARLMDIFAHAAQGDTDATRMVQTMLGALQVHASFGNADVLWISDFKIPLVVPELLKRIRLQHDRGTRFYGLQIGITEHEWEPYFDRMFRVLYGPFKK